MSRIIRILSLLLGCVTVGWPQISPDLLREISARYLDWSQNNTVLVEAMRRLPACSPRLSSLLAQSREAAAALAKANRQYFGQYEAALQKEIAGAEKLTAETSAAMNELKPLEELTQQYRQHLESKRAITGAGTSDTAPVDSSGVAELNRELRNGLSQEKTILQQITSGVEAEHELWTAYYNAVDASIRRKCLEADGAKPAPAKRR